MNRIELYVDRENRLSLDFYYNENDEYPISQFKGQKCYSIIAKLCESSILKIKNNTSTKEILIIFNGCTLNINEYDQVLKRKGTGPIKTKCAKYYEEKKLKSLHPKKVKRTNKYISKEIIAGALVLSILGFVIVKETLDKNEDKQDFSIEPTVTYQTEPPKEFVLDDLVNKNVSEIKINDNNFIIEENDFNKDNVFISYMDRSNTEKVRITKAFYGELINRYAKIYGVDPQIILAIATQERGIHSDKQDIGGATGLMQIQNEVWAGKSLTAYNYDLGKNETIIVDEEKLSDVFYNIKVGCMYFQNCMDYMNNNPIAAIQCYNYGYGNMQQVLKQYSLQTGKTPQQILSNISDCGWLDCRNVISENVGDRHYVENVISWLGPRIDMDKQKDQAVVYKLTITNLDLLNRIK